MDWLGPDPTRKLIYTGPTRSGLSTSRTSVYACEGSGGYTSFALSPPVTSYSAPVTMAAASEARKTAAGEMSSGCFRREGADRIGGAVQVVVDDIAPVAVLHIEQRHQALDGRPLCRIWRGWC